MEYLDVVDETGTPTGAVVSRAQAHAKGVRHRTSHVWILREKYGVVQVLLQKRSDDKDSYPGRYDISSAGHIPAGQGFVPSALRELREELGVDARAGDLHFCGRRCFALDEVFHGAPFHDRQVSNVYAMVLDREAAAFTPQPEEVSEVRWFALETCLRAVRQGAFPHCIYEEELRMVAAAVPALFPGE